MDDLKLKTVRRMAVLNPLKVTITNYEEGKQEFFDFPNNLENEELGNRKISFSKHLYIEKEDFVEVKPNNKYKRLSLGAEVRLMGSYFIKANEVIKDENGEVIEVLCTYDKNTLSGSGFNERKPQGTIQYVDAMNAKKAEFRLFDSLINANAPSEAPLSERFNKNSLTIVNGFVEASYNGERELKSQLIRNGYYSNDYDSTEDNIIINRTVSLKQSFK